MDPIGSFNDAVVNPITPGVPNRYSSYYIPTYTSNTLSEGFLEYQYSNIVNADIGYVAFDNSPWLAGNMYTNMLTVPTTYQGVGVNVYAGSGWVLFTLGFNAAQFGTDQQWLQGSNAINQSIGGGNIQSYVGGVQVGWSYSTMWQLNLSANTMWGASGSYNGGAFVSPYTQSLQVDPLYSEAWSYNMVTTGQPGNMYKVQGQFGLGSWGQNLIFQPSYVYVGNNNPTTNGLQELDLVLNYPLPQVRGLYLFGVYAQQWYNPNAAPAGLPDNNYQPIEIQSGVYYTW